MTDGAAGGGAPANKPAPQGGQPKGQGSAQGQGQGQGQGQWQGQGQGGKPAPAGQGQGAAQGQGNWQKGQQGQGQGQGQQGQGNWQAKQQPAGQGGQTAAQNQNKGQWQPPPVKAAVPAARMRRRHWGLIFSFLFLVLLPFGGGCYYLWWIAKDQYASVAGFTVRQEEGGGASELLGGLAQLTGSNVSADGDILYEFILSQSLVRGVDETAELSTHYSAHWDSDPAFALWPDPTIEDLEWYWGRVVRISYDKGTGLIDLRVLAFDPQKAQQIAQDIVRRSQEMINALNEQAREDAMRYALTDLNEAVDRLKAARESLTAFRSRTQIVDPEADIQGRMGVMNNLQQQLAEALIEFDLLRETTNAGDPRVTQAGRRIEVIRERIFDERRSFATADDSDQSLSEDYPSLIAEYEGLVVDREFAEENYRAALAAQDLARAKAERQSRYLATYIEPTLAESAEYPQRITIAGIFGVFLLLGWSVMALVFYSIRDRG